jgi:hypothetical protein
LGFPLYLLALFLSSETMKVPLIIWTTSLVFGSSWGFPTTTFLRSHHLSKKGDSNNVYVATSSAESKIGAASGAFSSKFYASDCDDFNVPPSLSIIMRSLTDMASGSDIRGRFVDHPRSGNMASVAQAIGKSNLPALTPLAAHCLGFAFATMLRGSYPENEELVIGIGKDPRLHGAALADAFGRGAGGVQHVRVVYTGVATTPAMFEFCR